MAMKADKALKDKINEYNVVDAKEEESSTGLVAAEKVLIVQMVDHKVVRVVEVDPTPELLNEEIIVVPYKGEQRLAIIENI